MVGLRGLGKNVSANRKLRNMIDTDMASVTQAARSRLLRSIPLYRTARRSQVEYGPFVVSLWPEKQ